MAYVTTNTDSLPFMDKLSHSIIKETSKSLKHYLNVKRREDAFILSPSVSTWDSLPIKARFMYGTTKQYPPLYASCYTDNDVKTCLRSIQQQQKNSHGSSNDLERRICREELNFHMRPHKPIAIENRQFSRLNLRPARRANSSSSGSTVRVLKQGLSKSTSYENNHIVDDTADILANMVKARRSMHTSNYGSRQDTPAYVSRNTNPSPRQTDEPDGETPNENNGSTAAAPANLPRPKKHKRKTDNPSAKLMLIMREAKTITNEVFCDYKITVTTGNCNGASTDAPIQIKLYGKKGSTTFVNLEQSESHRVAFRRNQSDTFVVRTHHVGALAGITIGHDQSNAKSGWFLSKVVIEDPIRERTHEIQCNSWLSSRSNDQRTMRDFTVSSTVSQRQQSASRNSRSESQNQSDTSSTVTSDRSRNNRSPQRPSSRDLTNGQRSNAYPISRGNDSSNGRQKSSSPPSSPSPHSFKAKGPKSPTSSTQTSKKASTKPVDSPVISRSPSPKSRRNTYTRVRSTSPPNDQSRLTSATTSDHALDSKKNTFERNDSSFDDPRRPPSRLETRSPARSSRIEKKNDDDEENVYADDFFD